MNLLTFHSITNADFLLFHAVIVMVISIFTLALALTTACIGMFNRAKVDKWITFLLNVCKIVIVLAASLIIHIVIKLAVTGGKI